jgi:hypothetical protein
MTDKPEIQRRLPRGRGREKMAVVVLTKPDGRLLRCYTWTPLPAFERGRRGQRQNGHLAAAIGR